jgi:FlaA1/EpsC-like NDP-sugar epimerase
MKQMLFTNFDMFVADVKSERKMEIIFEQTRPDIVFHAAAYKHVPLMEVHPDEGILNNVQGTLNVARVSGEYGVSSFVNISTDKAVDPINILGATKRLGERLVAELDTYYPETTYCSVRFGNVLGSRGSVIPIFREQILKGGPVTITDPQMTRFFMTITEAVDLVLQAASFLAGNVIYVLDMGKPEKIVDLAKQMITFMKPDKNIEIIFTGIRPGEKLNEYLYESGEEADSSAHPKIFRVNPFSWDDATILNKLPVLFDAARSNDHEEIREALQEWIPTYHPFETNKTGMIAADLENVSTKELTSITADCAEEIYMTDSGEPSTPLNANSDSNGFSYNWTNQGNREQNEESPLIERRLRPRD